MAKRRMMWMGPRNYERWVPASDARNDFSRIGNREQDQYLNGGSGIRGTKESHREYNLTWTGWNFDDLRPVLDMAEGLYDTDSNELIYFLDPSTLERNVLPPNWGAPYKSGLDGVPLLDDNQGYPQYPEVVPTATNFLGYPARSARYYVGQGSVPKPLYVPIPEGMVLWVGAHGVDEGACVAVTPVRGPSAFSPVRLPMQTVTTRDRVSTAFRSADGYTGVELSLVPTDPATYAWTGTANASTSVKRVNGAVVRTNLAARPIPADSANNVANGAFGWNTQWYGNGGSGATAIVSNATDTPFSTVKSYSRKTWSAVGSNADDVGWRNSLAGTNGYPVSPGKTYSISSSVRFSRAQSGTRPNRMVITWSDSSGNTVGSSSGPIITDISAGKWLRFGVTATAPAGAAFMAVFTYVSLDLSTLAAGDTVDGTALIVEDSSSVGSYFDGNTPNTLTGYATLSGIIAQVLPEGTPPLPGDYISGRGNSGCEFAGYPTESPYLNGRKSAVSAKLVEVGAWQ